MFGCKQGSCRVSQVTTHMNVISFDLMHMKSHNSPRWVPVCLVGDSYEFVGKHDTRCSQSQTISNWVCLGDSSKLVGHYDILIQHMGTRTPTWFFKRKLLCFQIYSNTIFFLPQSIKPLKIYTDIPTQVKWTHTHKIMHFPNHVMILLLIHMPILFPIEEGASKASNCKSRA